MRKTICIDFDGVLHSYVSGWRGAGTISDPPVEGAIDWLLLMLKHYDVCIYSSRSKHPMGRWAMRRWLRRHLRDYLDRLPPEAVDSYLLGLGLSVTESMDPWDTMLDDAVAVALHKLRFPLFKPAAWLTIDDRAVCFEGRFPVQAEIDGFTPWYKRRGGA